jgi:hypothetical protein
MACKLRCYISSLLVVALSPPHMLHHAAHNQNPPHKAKATKTQTPTSSLHLVGGTKKSTYLCRVCAPIVFRIATSGSLYNNQQLLAENGGGLDLWRRRKRKLVGACELQILQGQAIEGIFLDL